MQYSWASFWKDSLSVAIEIVNFAVRKYDTTEGLIIRTVTVFGHKRSVSNIEPLNNVTNFK